MTILIFRDENEIPFCYSHVSRRDRDFRKSFLVVEREKMKLTLVENSRDREFSLTSDAVARFCTIHSGGAGTGHRNQGTEGSSGVEWGSLGAAHFLAA